jgi:hypothetical protein
VELVPELERAALVRDAREALGGLGDRVDDLVVDLVEEAVELRRTGKFGQGGVLLLKGRKTNDCLRSLSGSRRLQRRAAYWRNGAARVATGLTLASR